MGVFILSMRQRKDTLIPHYGFISQKLFSRVIYLFKKWHFLNK